MCSVTPQLGKCPSEAPGERMLIPDGRRQRRTDVQREGRTVPGCDVQREGRTVAGCDGHVSSLWQSPGGSRSLMGLLTAGGAAADADGGEERELSSIKLPAEGTDGEISRRYPAKWKGSIKRDKGFVTTWSHIPFGLRILQTQGQNRDICS
ncbi:hypothetical protein H8959_012255 [Pygathrix nigripes]